MPRPSEPLLARLREVLKSKGISTAHIADVARITRPRMGKILTGTVVMTVDELMNISHSLQLDPSDLTEGVARWCVDVDSDPVPHNVEVLHPNGVVAPRNDPWSSQPKDLFRILFKMGCNFLFLADINQLDDSGIPTHVLKFYQGGDLPIQLPATHHRYNQPRYFEEGIRLTLAFGTVYECKFSWSCIKKFVLFPAPSDPVQPEAGETPANDPHLRLVT